MNENIKEIHLPLNLSKMGNYSFATNGYTDIYINENKKTPPKFVDNNGIELTTENILPFGNGEKIEKSFYIFIPAHLYSTYINNIHWKKYKKNIQILT